MNMTGEYIDGALLASCSRILAAGEHSSKPGLTQDGITILQRCCPSSLAPFRSKDVGGSNWTQEA